MVICFFEKQARLWRNSTYSAAMMSVASLTLSSSFFIIAFASFVEAQHDFSQTFSAWLKVSFCFWNVSRVAYRCRVVGKDRDSQVGPQELTYLFRSSP